MAFLLDRISAASRLLQPNGTVQQWFQRLWQKNCELTEEAISDLTATVARLRRIPSHTNPTTILVATEDGADVTIEVLDHVRVYGDATTLAITGNDTDGAGLLPDTLYGCYYDDETLLEQEPEFHFTTDIAEAQAVAAAGRHWCGAILTPTLASGDTIESGGAYPAGSSIGGELV